MNNINFFTPIRFDKGSTEKIKLENNRIAPIIKISPLALQFIDSYFSFFSGRQVIEVTFSNDQVINKRFSISSPKASPLHLTCWKILQFISYITVLIPIVFLIAKGILRHQFEEWKLVRELENSVDDWVNERDISDDQKYKRNQAASRIIDAAEWRQDSLDLSQLSLSSLPSKIGNLRNLRNLELGNNQLTSLPPEIGNLRNLWYLDLRNNQLPSLPPEIRNLRNLSYLNLGSNRLTSLPPQIGNLRNLRHLDLYNNELTSLPPEIGNFRNLENLILSTNRLPFLPPQIRNLRNLLNLNLGSNRLTSLPPEIGNLRNLQYLTLSSNQLTSLPPQIGNLEYLTELLLGGNLLTSLPDEIGQLMQLRHLHLENNHLTDLPLSLLELTGNLSIRAEQNRFSPATAQSIQNRRNEIHNRDRARGPNILLSIRDANDQPALSLEQAIDFWVQQFNSKLPVNLKQTVTFKPLFSDEDSLLSALEKGYLQAFLQKLPNISDFRNSPDKVIRKVIRMLEEAISNEKFRKKLSSLLLDASSSCGDRATYYLNKIELYQRLLCNPSNTPKEFANQLIGMQRAALLENIAKTISMQRGFGDEMEILLYFQLKLKKTLNLPISTENMLYAGMARGITDEDLEPVAKYILDNTRSPEQIGTILSNPKEIVDGWIWWLITTHPDLLPQIALQNEEILAFSQDISEAWVERLRAQHNESFNKFNEDFIGRLEAAKTSSTRDQEYLEREKDILSQRESELQQLIADLTRQELFPDSI